MQLYLLSSLSPSLFSLSFLPPHPPPASDGVWSWHVYKTGFYCYLNTSGRTRSSQPAEQDFSTVSCPLSEIAGNVNLIGFPFPGQWIRNAALSSWAFPSLHLPCSLSLSSFWVLIAGQMSQYNGRPSEPRKPRLCWSQWPAGSHLWFTIQMAAI